MDTPEDASNPEKVASKIEFFISHVYIGNITNKMRMSMEIKKSVDVLFNEVAQCNALTAAIKYDSTRGFKFIAYAVWWIRQPMLVAIESKK